VKRAGVAFVVLIAVLLVAGVVAFFVVGKAYKIVSPSMSPSLQPGDRVLVIKFEGRLKPDVGDIVAYRTPGGACGTPGVIVVHRIARRTGSGSFVMRGDNADQACDSRTHGPVPRKNLIGQVVAIYWPPTRWALR
jgi:signal peptidase I